jgi:hypothetical protein
MVPQVARTRGIDFETWQTTNLKRRSLFPVPESGGDPGYTECDAALRTPPNLNVTLLSCAFPVVMQSGPTGANSDGSGLALLQYQPSSTQQPS